LKAQNRWEGAVKRFHQANGHKAAFSNDVFA
jgi:hypothetical protein